MATYSYQALNASGKTQKGTIEAASSEEALQRIKAQGYFPTSVQPVKEKKTKTKTGEQVGATTKKKKKGGGLSFGRVKPKALTLFTRQLSTLQDAGLPLLRSLQILESQQKPGKMKTVLMGVSEEVEGGSSLSESMGKFPKAFNHLYVKMVNAGEIGGVLDLILQRLAEFMEKSERLKRKIKGALVYPIVVILIAVIILTFIMVFIIPKFTEIFADFEVELPGLTLWLMDTSSWMAGTRPGQEIPGFVFIILGGPALWIGFKLIRKTPPGRAVVDVLLLWTPIFGKLIRKTTIARFTRTLGTLIGAGVPILEAVTITAETSGNYVYEKALKKVHDSIREGESFAGPLRESKTCDAIVVNMIDVGEETGDMDAMLMKIADNYDEEVDVAVESLVSLLEPLMVVVLGGMVGTIVVAMFLPMVKMIESLQ
ncbi:type II secretion system F family protein [Nodularia spumigena]|uniref:type II secretion system F family protein n=1 Tax=Nodularia spumigena TaxID=70799 RepID=UPI002B21A917|nr:type II secretion system F family protein [Nodularia spumigena]MEA5614856.1 type II secretion system F family protein [Nodularia spumigena UHCC 0040]